MHLLGITTLYEFPLYATSSVPFPPSVNKNSVSVGGVTTESIRKKTGCKNIIFSPEFLRE